MSSSDRAEHKCEVVKSFCLRSNFFTEIEVNLESELILRRMILM